MDRDLSKHGAQGERRGSPYTVSWQILFSRSTACKSFILLQVSSVDEFTSSLSFSSLRTTHSGNYTCKAENRAAEADVRSATLVVNSKSVPLVFNAEQRRGLVGTGGKSRVQNGGRKQKQLSVIASHRPLRCYDGGGTAGCTKQSGTVGFRIISLRLLEKLMSSARRHSEHSLSDLAVAPLPTASNQHMENKGTFWQKLCQFWTRISFSPSPLVDLSFGL